MTIKKILLLVYITNNINIIKNTFGNCSIIAELFFKYRLS